MFKYVLIPAVESEPISTLEASKAGGLTDDALSKNAKQYFFEKSNSSASAASALSNEEQQQQKQRRAELLSKATPVEKKQIADKIRKRYAATAAKATVDTKKDGSNDSDEAGVLAERVRSMTDDEIIELLKVQEEASNSAATAASSPSCEIICITIPTKLNGQTAVSLYGDDLARRKNYQYNIRATKLMMACGHAFPSSSTSQDDDGKPNGIYGDVFVGRAIDDEMEDIWERVDILPDEIGASLPAKDLEWCKVAKRKGGGGGHGGNSTTGPHSLSKTLQSFQKQQLLQQQKQQNPQSSTTANSDTTNAEDDTNLNYTWSQTEDEVEMKFVVPKGTKAKDVKVKFGTKSISVSFLQINTEHDNNEEVVLCNGTTWDTIDIDGSTYTLQDVQPENRELCLSLEKYNSGQTWNYAIEE